MVLVLCFTISHFLVGCLMGRQSFKTVQKKKKKKFPRGTTVCLNLMCQTLSRCFTLYKKSETHWDMFAWWWADTFSFNKLLLLGCEVSCRMDQLSSVSSISAFPVLTDSLTATRWRHIRTWKQTCGIASQCIFYFYIVLYTPQGSWK